ncbi:MAG: DUF2142 domain-containing protein [Lachnospiraceae bacterium]|nr:DUF2142 domain-containing protein [Lachnospiraceae bacterium]
MRTGHKAGHKSGAFCLRLLIKFAIAMLAALLIEVLFNVPAFTSGYSSVAVSGESERTDEGLVYQAAFEEPLYIGKLEIRGVFGSNSKYTINYTVINDFGVEKEAVQDDFVYSVFDCAYTNINATVSEMEIVFADADGVTLDGIYVSNEVCFHFCRILFFALVLWFVLLLFSERQFIMEKVEWVYVIFALSFGMLVIVLAGPRAVGWDEEVHYSSMYATNIQKETVWSEAASANTARLTPDPNTAEELSMLVEYMNEAGETTSYTEASLRGIRQEWFRYLPMILLYQIGRGLKLSYTTVFYMGRFGNLLFCVAMTWLAIRLAKRRKVLIAALGMLPTVLFQCSMYTYDGIIFTCVNLGFVLWVNEVEKIGGGLQAERSSHAGQSLQTGLSAEKPNLRNMVCIMLLFTIACISKPVYLPLYLLLLPLFHRLLKGRGYKKKQKRVVLILIACLAVACVAAVAIYLAPTLLQILQGNISDLGDSRGGDTGAVGQLISILRHPFAFVKMLIHDMVSLDTFWQWEGTTSTLASNAMFLSFYVLGSLKDEWSYFLLALLALLFLFPPEEKASVYMPGSTDDTEGKRQGNPSRLRLLNGAVVLLCVVLTWVAMYLMFTPIGNDTVTGVQPRYYLPLLLPLAYALRGTRFSARISKLRYYQIALGGSLLLTGLCVYQCLIAGRAV